MEINKYEEMEELEKFHWWFIYRQKILKFFLKNYLLDLNKAANIIDIGCGTGGNIQILSEYFDNITGIDNNDLAINYCREKGFENIIKGELPELTMIEDDSADLILLFDVLEHVDDDEFSLSVMSNKLKDNGYLLMTVPAFNFLWSQHDTDFHHKRRYNLKILKKLIQKLGFKIIKASYIYFLLFPLILFMRILKQFFKNLAKKDDFQLNNKFLNLFIIKFLSIEKLLLKWINFPFGSSIIILAKK